MCFSTLLHDGDTIYLFCFFMMLYEAYAKMQKMYQKGVKFQVKGSEKL